MKKLSILVLLLTSITLLSGCFYNTEETPAAPTEVNADTLLDDQLYESAVRGDNAGKCDLISEAAKAGECKKVVTANLLTAKAVAEMDDDACGDIELARYEKVCELRVEETIASTEAAEKEIEAFKESDQNRMKIETEAMIKKDYTICAQISDENDMVTCKWNVITKEVITQEDNSLCKKIGRDEEVTLCEESFN